MMNSKPRILLADNDFHFAKSLKTRLEENQFEVIHCFDGEAAWKEFSKKTTYNFCLLNVMIPKKDGFELASKIRSVNQYVPILFISNTKNQDSINGFRVGGDGWMVKPFSVLELIYRIKVLIKRSGMILNDNNQITFKVGDSIFNYSERIITDIHGSKLADLTKKTAEVLRYFCLKPNTVIPRTELLYACWGTDNYFNGRSLDVFITRLRTLIKDINTVSLDTVYRIGFRFNMPPNIDKPKY